MRRKDPEAERFFESHLSHFIWGGGTILPTGVLPTCGQNDSFFCSVKNSFRGVLKIPSEEISHRVGKIVWAKSFSFLLFCPKEE